jgi:MoaA/NifB/PqqE/SkfB family radical SAM enzyme
MSKKNDSLGVRLFGGSNDTPSTLHCLVTTRCNLACNGCYYFSGKPGEWTWDFAEDMIWQAEELGVAWLAIGGGEPTEWRYLNDFCTLASRRFAGMNVAVTTNGINCRPINADVVHISYDQRHIEQWPEDAAANQVDTMLEIIDYYQELGCKVGINTVLSSVPGVEDKVLKAADSITFVLDKPWDPWPEWKKEFRQQYNRCSEFTRVSADSCIAQLMWGRCAQGRTSMAVDQHGRYSACSNCGKKYEASGLQVGWDLVRAKGAELPEGCILEEKDVGNTEA